MSSHWTRKGECGELWMSLDPPGGVDRLWWPVYAWKEAIQCDHKLDPLALSAAGHYSKCSKCGAILSDRRKNERRKGERRTMFDTYEGCRRDQPGRRQLCWTRRDGLDRRKT